MWEHKHTKQDKILLKAEIISILFFSLEAGFFRNALSVSEKVWTYSIYFSSLEPIFSLWRSIIPKVVFDIWRSWAWKFFNIF